MNFNKRYFALLVLVLFLFTTTGSVLADPELEKNQVAAGYDYPIKPGSDEWRAFRTHQQMIEATIIPEKILKSLTTDEVIASLFNHPLLPDTFVFNTLQGGFDAFLKRANVLQELLQRKDRSIKLLNTYKTMQPLTDLSNKDVSAQARQITSLSFMEILLAQPEIRNEFTKQQLAEVEAEVEKKQAIRLAHPELYGSQPSYYEKVLKESYSLLQL